MLSVTVVFVYNFAIMVDFRNIRTQVVGFFVVKHDNGA